MSFKEVTLDVLEKIIETLDAQSLSSLINMDKRIELIPNIKEILNQKRWQEIVYQKWVKEVLRLCGTAFRGDEIIIAHPEGDEDDILKTKNLLKLTLHEARNYINVLINVIDSINNLNMNHEDFLIWYDGIEAMQEYWPQTIFNADLKRNKIAMDVELLKKIPFLTAIAYCALTTVDPPVEIPHWKEYIKFD